MLQFLSTLVFRICFKLLDNTCRLIRKIKKGCVVKKRYQFQIYDNSIRCSVQSVAKTISEYTTIDHTNSEVFECSWKYLSTPSEYAKAPVVEPWVKREPATGINILSLLLTTTGKKSYNYCEFGCGIQMSTRFLVLFLIEFSRFPSSNNWSFARHIHKTMQLCSYHAMFYILSWDIGYQVNNLYIKDSFSRCRL